MRWLKPLDLITHVRPPLCIALTLKLFNADVPVQHEEKRLATWGTDVPQDLVLDPKKLAESLKKVSVLYLTFGIFLFIISPLWHWSFWF